MEYFLKAVHLCDVTMHSRDQSAGTSLGGGGGGGGMGAAANGSRIMGAAKSVEKKVNKKTCSEFNTF